MEVLRLWPLSQGEISGVREGFVDALFRSELPDATYGGEGRAGLVERALRGGYPEAVGRSGARRSAWFRSYVELLLARDVRDLAEIDRLTALPRLLELLAARAGSLSNFAELARSASIPQTTLKRYFALLAGVFLVVAVPAWTVNPSKRLVRSPKLYLADSGLLAHLLHIGPEAVRDRPDSAGRLIENLVAMEIQKQIGWSDARCRLHHFRTAAGREVDLVLEDERGRLVGIEVKAASAASRVDFNGLEALAEAAGAAFHRGVVLYSGAERVAFGPRLHALPIDALWSMEAAEVREPVPR
jgi:predicted AAA+ superfamily ATPase